MSLRSHLHGQSDRVCVVGLDCASPHLVFGRWWDELPNLRRLAEAGVFGELRSCHPPITVPAWRVMASGHSAGEHGVYGFRKRTGRGYDDFALTESTDFEAEMIWERLANEGLRTTLVGLPGTYPPTPLAGKMISGLLTPDAAEIFTWPAALGARVRRIAPDYAFDVRGFREVDADELVARVRTMTRARFRVARELARDDDWNLFWLVEIGLDRLHHALWHTLEDPDSGGAAALRDYYHLLDAELGGLVAVCDDGDTSFVVVSDHGARAMKGGIALNRLLEAEGLLTLVPGTPAGPYRSDAIDWKRTRAWATGGYVARIYFNVKGREPEGIVEPHEIDALVATISEQIRALVGPHGRKLKHGIDRPTTLYSECRGVAPDLVVILGDLDYRGVDTIGPGPLHVADNDRGADTANHDWMGLYLASGPSVVAGGRTAAAPLEGIASFIEQLLLAERVAEP